MNTIPVRVYEGDKFIGLIGYKITGKDQHEPVWLPV